MPCRLYLQAQSRPRPIAHDPADAVAPSRRHSLFPCHDGVSRCYAVACRHGQGSYISFACRRMDSDVMIPACRSPPSHDHSVRLLRFQPSSWPTKTLQFDTHDGFAFGSIPSKDRRCFTYPGLGRGPLHHGRKRIATRDDGFCWSILVPTAVFTDSQSGLETVLSSSRSSESLLGSVKTKHPFLSLCLVLNILVSYVMNGVFCSALCSGTFRTNVM